MEKIKEKPTNSKPFFQTKENLPKNVCFCASILRFIPDENTLKNSLRNCKSEIEQNKIFKNLLIFASTMKIIQKYPQDFKNMKILFHRFEESFFGKFLELNC